MIGVNAKANFTHRLGRQCCFWTGTSEGNLGVGRGSDIAFGCGHPKKFLGIFHGNLVNPACIFAEFFRAFSSGRMEIVVGASVNTPSPSTIAASPWTTCSCTSEADRSRRNGFDFPCFSHYRQLLELSTSHDLPQPPLSAFLCRSRLKADVALFIANRGSSPELRQQLPSRHKGLHHGHQLGALPRSPVWACHSTRRNGRS